jgi:hypothetical protein
VKRSNLFNLLRLPRRSPPRFARGFGSPSQRLHRIATPFWLAMTM